MVNACDAFIAVVAAVAELYALPKVWQALPMGLDFSIQTRSLDWEERRVLPAPPQEKSDAE